MAQRPVTVVCIPAYNEERTIARVILLSRKHCDQILVCDDGSSDMTAPIAEGLGAKVIRHMRNMGKGEALRSLFAAARELDADVMVTLDGDGQHDPDEIPRVVDPISRGEADIVIGARFYGGGNEIPAYRKVGNKLLNAVTISGISDTQSGFRGYGKRAIDVVRPAEMGMVVDSEILMDAAKQGLRMVEVPVSVRYGIGKTSTHNPIFHTLDVLVSAIKLTSIRHPMMFYGIPGLGIVAVGGYFILHAFLQILQSQIITNVIITYELLGFSLVLFGLFTFFTGIILFTLSTVLRKGTD